MAHPHRFVLAGVMGWPIRHSRSPRIHNYWFAQHNIAGTYLPLAIEPDGLRAALRALPALGFAGVNLTIPHKETALSIVDEADPLARRIGAVNCVVVRKDQSLLGLNHDGWGYIQSCWARGERRARFSPASFRMARAKSASSTARRNAPAPSPSNSDRR